MASRTRHAGAVPGEQEPMVAGASDAEAGLSPEVDLFGRRGPGACDLVRRLWRIGAAVLLLVVAGGSSLALARVRAAAPLMALPPPNSTHLPVFGDYEPIDPLAMGECTGVLMAAVLWTANIGLILRSAANWCQVERNFQEIKDENFPWYPNGTPKAVQVPILQTPDETLGFRRLAYRPPPPIDRKAFLEMALNRKEHEGDMSEENREAYARLKQAKDHALEAVTKIDNDTLAERWELFLSQQYSDLVARCVRDALEFVSASAIVALFGEAAEWTCIKGEWNGRDCAGQVTGIVNKFHRAARGAAQMELRCPSRSDDFMPADTAKPDVSYGCEGRMEIVGWELSTIGSKMEKALAYCPGGPGEVVHNYGGCVTMVVSAAAYVGAAGIAFEAARVVDCDNMTSTDVALALRAMAGDDDAYERLVNGYHTRGLACARDIVAGARTLGLATMQATKAAEYCGTLPHMACKTDIASSMTAFIAAAESAILAAADCQLRPYATTSDVKRVKTDCTAYSASWVKEMSVTAALAIQAADSCRVATAAGECGRSISTALAAFGYMLERTAFAGRNCELDGVRTGRRGFACGQNLEQAGDAVIVASAAIGAATMNCGLGLVRAKTKPKGLNRRFYVPR